MFEKFKLNKFFNDMVGFAYEFGEGKSGKVVMQIYIVTKQGDEYKFVKYKKYNYYTFEMLYSIADEFSAKPISYYSDLVRAKQLKKTRN